ncbi:MAG: radical SAM protein [Chloroflexi bacterium]|nr:radical SAM protein [Chloroflexota bacterium]
MEYAETDIMESAQLFMQELGRKVRQQRVPISGTIELTKRCNLRCVHCYLGPQEEYHRNKDQEIGTQEVKTLIDDVVAAGCLYLLITGGDPILRKDFPEIYRYAKEKGLLVTVFTNGTLVTNRIIRLFKELPPSNVEVSLYGAREETYERITDVKGSYNRCIAGIQRLYDNNINFSLKTVLMQQNKAELDEIEGFADKYGVNFRFDAGIFPTLAGDKTPLQYRVTPEEAVAADLSSPARREQWIELKNRSESLVMNDNLYQCGAGLTNFHVTPYGKLQACIMTERYQFDLADGDFSTGWENEIALIREVKAPASFGCNSCSNRSVCGSCPAFSDLENGEEYIKSEYVCSTGHLRAQAIELLQLEELAVIQ